jgi:endoglucanase
MKLIQSWVLVVAAGLLALGCKGTKGGGETGAAEAPEIKPEDVTRCGPDGLIDDCEDNDNQVANVASRAGYWYVFVDEAGTTVDPPAGGSYTMTEGGANGSGYAACVKGKISENGSPLHAGVGFNWVEPKAEYDAAKYGGIAFWAKSAPGKYNQIRVKIPDLNTDPQGGVCEECYNDFGMDIELSETWTEYVVTWEAAKQMPYWGKPKPPKIDATKLYGFQVQVNKAGQEFDLCIDDITFIGCGAK